MNLLALLFFLIPSREIIIEVPQTTIVAETTMYSSVETCEDKCIMANGQEAFIGAAACPREIPLNSLIQLENKTYKCADRTHLKYNGRYDLFAGYGEKSHELAINYGKKSLEIKIIK